MQTYSTAQLAPVLLPADTHWALALQTARQIELDGNSIRSAESIRIDYSQLQQIHRVKILIKLKVWKLLQLTEYHKSLTNRATNVKFTDYS